MTTTIRGDEELQRKLGKLKDLSFLKPVVRAGAVVVKGYMAQYPESSEANRPNDKGRWYERGYGPKWIRADGTIRGRQTSETLRKRWTTASRKGGLAQVIGNNASYARPVQDAEQQAKFHGRRGWRTDADAVEAKSAEVLKLIQKAVDRELAK